MNEIFPAFRILLVSLEHGFARVRLIAPFAANTSQVFGHVPGKAKRVGQNAVADAAGRVAQVKLIVVNAAFAHAERLLAHVTNKTPISFDNPHSARCLDLQRLLQRIACKFQVAR